MNHVKMRSGVFGVLALSGVFVAATPARAQERWNPNLMICGTSSDGVWPGSGGNCQASLPPAGTGLLYPNDFAEVIDPVTQTHHLLVADTENGRVLRFLDDGSAITFAGELAAGSFLEPFGVVGDAAGNILVADSEKVHLFNWNGEAIGQPFTRCVDDPTPFSQPYRVTVTPGTKVTPGDTAGNVLIIDTGNNRVVICDGAMTFRANFGNLPDIPNADPGAFFAPTGLAVDQTGHLYVADPNNVRVQVFDWNESLDLQLPPALHLGSQPAWIISNEVPRAQQTSVPEMLYPFGLAIDANGRLLVADAGVNKMWVFDTLANQLKELNVNIGTGSTCDQDCWPPPPPGPPGELLVPANISLDSTGRLMIADAYNMRVQRFTHPPMTVTITPPNATVQLNQPLQLTVAVQAASGIFTSVQLEYTADVLVGNISSLGTPTIQAETTDTVTAGQGPTNFTMTFATTGVATFAFHVWATGIPDGGSSRIEATDGAGITEPISVGVSGNYPTTAATVTSPVAPVSVNEVLWYTTQPNVHLVSTGHPDPPNAIYYKIAIEQPVPGATDYSTCGQNTLDAGACDVAITLDGLTRLWYRAKSTTADIPPVDLVAAWESIDVHYDAQPPLVIDHTLSPAAINGWNNSSFTITYYLFKGAVGWPTDASGNPLVANSGTIQVVAGPAPTEQADSSDFVRTVPEFKDAAGRSTEENGPVQFHFKLDTVAPTVSASGAPIADAWATGPVTVTFAASDAMSGVLTVHYDLRNAANVTTGFDLTLPRPLVTGPVSVSAVVSSLGKNTVTFYAVDDAGNRSASKTIDVWINRQLTVTAVEDSKIYDRTASSTAPPLTAGFFGSDSGSFTQAFDTPNVGASKTLTPAGTLNPANSDQYTVTFVPVATGTITARTVTASISALNKTYDGNATATVGCTLTGVVAGETVTCAATGTFADANVGTGKAVTATGITLGGPSAGNYTLNGVTSATTTANITPAPTQTSLVASPNPVTAGLTLTLTATVTTANPTTGSVTFSDGGVALGTAVALTGNTASLTTTTLAIGLHPITAKYVHDANHQESSTSLTVNVTVKSANAAPVCTSASATPNLLWPPNHKFVTIGIRGVTDPDGDALTIKVTKIWQDELTMADGSGDTPIDGNILGSTQVRAERAGNGNGRVYEIFFTATDTKGGSCGGSVTVAVPHDQSGAPAFDSGVRYDSLVKNGPRVR